MVDTYVDNSIPFPDVKEAAVLYVGNAIKYVVRKDSQVSSEFILSNISVNRAKIFPREDVLFLGTALLWAYYSNDEISQLLPQSHVEKIKAKVAQLQGTLESNENPFKKVQTLVSGEGGV